MAACVLCTLAAFHSAAVISRAAAAGQVFLYLGVTDHRTALVLDGRVVSSLITQNFRNIHRSYGAPVEILTSGLLS